MKKTFKFQVLIIKFYLICINKNLPKKNPKNFQKQFRADTTKKLLKQYSNGNLIQALQSGHCMVSAFTAGGGGALWNLTILFFSNNVNCHLKKHNDYLFH